jgi:hypothetical protein
MTERTAQKGENVTTWVYKRMLLGAAAGFMLLVAVGYYWRVYPGPVHPLAGMGLLFLGFVGAVLGAIVSLFSRKWESQKDRKRVDSEG